MEDTLIMMIFSISSLEENKEVAVAKDNNISSLVLVAVANNSSSRNLRIFSRIQM